MRELLLDPVWWFKIGCMLCAWPLVVLICFFKALFGQEWN